MSEQSGSDATPAATGGRSRSWLYELPLAYLALYAVQQGAFPEDPGYRSFNPNAYWIGVLLFALRYGSGPGLVAGLASAALYALGARQAGEGYRLADADFYLTPGLFAAGGLALGAVADRFALRLAALDRRVKDSAERVAGLQRQLDVQQKAMRAVEQQVVSQMSSIVTLYEGSRALGALDRESLLDAVLDFYTDALQAAKTALYVPRDGKWVLRGSRGWAEGDAYPVEIASGEGLVGRAIADKRVVSLKDLFAVLDESAAGRTGADAIMAAPLLDSNGEMAAVFAVQAMPFLGFNSAAVSLLALLAGWGEESLAKCRMVDELKQRSLLDESLDLHSAHYCADRARQEFARSKRYALPFSVLLVDVPTAGLPEARRAALLGGLGRALRELSREIDVVAKAPFGESVLAILLVTAPKEQAEAARRQIAENVAGLGLPEGLRVGAASFDLKMQHVEELFERARASLA